MKKLAITEFETAALDYFRKKHPGEEVVLGRIKNQRIIIVGENKGYSLASLFYLYSSLNTTPEQIFEENAFFIPLPEGYKQKKIGKIMNREDIVEYMKEQQEWVLREVADFCLAEARLCGAMKAVATLDDHVKQGNISENLRDVLEDYIYGELLVG